MKETRRVWRPGALLIVILTFACSEFPVDPDADLHDEPARFDVRASLTSLPDEEGRAVWSITAHAHLGIVQGLVGSFADSLLRINGDGVDPASPTRLGLLYESQLDIAPDSAHLVEIRVSAPTIQGVPESSVLFSGFGRSGPDTIRLAPGADLILPVAAPSRPADPAPLALRWHVTVVDADGSILSLQAFADPPDPLVIPRDLLSQAASPLTVSFSFAFGGKHLDADTLMVTRYSVTGSYDWVVETE